MTEPPVPGSPDDLIISGTGRTEEEHWRYTLRKLGGNVVDIELTSIGDTDPLTGEVFGPGETHQEDCIADTKRWYAHRVGYKKAVQLALANGQSDYLMPQDTTDVVSVWLPSFQLPSLDADQFSYTYFSLLFGQWTNPNVAPMPYSDLVQRLQYLETIGRIFSTDRDWDYIKESRTLRIMPAPASIGSFGGGSFALVTAWSRDVDTTRLDPEEEDFFRRKLLAEAMKTLGMVRSKWDSVPAVGGERSLSGDVLMDRAESIQDQLKIDVMNWKRPLPFITG